MVLGMVGGVAITLTGGAGFEPGVLGRVSPGWLLLALGLALVPWFSDAARLGIWSRWLGHPLPRRSLLRVVLGTELASAVSPTAVGGAPAKVALLSGAGVPVGRSITLSLLKSLEDGLFFALALPLTFRLSGAGRLPGPGTLVESVRLRVDSLSLSPGWILLLLALAALVAWRLRIRPRGRRAVTRSWAGILEAAALLRGAGWRRFGLSFLLTAIQWSARYSVVTCLAVGLGVQGVEPLRYWVLQWVVFTAMTLVPTPGAAGGAEAAFAIAYAGVLPRQQLGWLTLGWRVLTFYLLLTLGALLFSALSVRRGVPVVDRIASERGEEGMDGPIPGLALAEPTLRTPAGVGQRTGSPSAD